MKKVLISLTIILIAVGGFYLIKGNDGNTLPLSESAALVTRTISPTENPKGFLEQMKKELGISSIVTMVVGAENTWQIALTKNSISSAIPQYLASHLKSLTSDTNGLGQYVNSNFRCSYGEAREKDQTIVACANYMMSGASMLPTLAHNQTLKTTSLASLVRGDIIVAYQVTSDGIGTVLVKRIIGLPEEEVKINGLTGEIYINSVLQNGIGPIIKTAKFASQINVKLGSDEYYVLGDKTEQSYDSRSFGPLKGRDILAKVIIE